MFDAPSTTTLRLIGLARVSGIGQAADDRLGLPRQIASLEGIARAHGASLEIIQIADVSGSDVAKTPEWRDIILPALRAGAHLAVDSIDRLNRADGLDISILTAVASAGARIYSPGQVRDLGNSDDALVVGLLALLGGREKKEIVRRAAAAKEAGRRVGRWVCGAPTPRGTTFDAKVGTWGYDSDVDTVRYIYRSYADGASVADLVRATGWTRQVVELTLNHPIYSGWLVYDHRCDGELVESADGRQGHRRLRKRRPDEVIRVQVFGLPGQEDPIVSDSLWSTVQARRQASAKRHVRSARETSQHGWYSGMVDVHDAPDVQGLDLGNGFRELGLETTKHKLYVGKAPDGYRYSCTCRSKDIAVGLGRCSIGSPNATRINDGIDSYLTRLTTADDFQMSLRTALASTEAVPDARDAIRSSLIERQQKAEAKKARLLDLYLDGGLPKDVYNAKLGEIETEIARIQAEIAKLDQAPILPTVDDLDRLAASWAFDPAWDIDRKREWIRRYLVSVSVSRDGVETVTLRLPAADGSVVYCGGLGAMSWVELLPPEPVRYTTGQVAEKIGVPLWKLTDSLKVGKVPKPTEKCGRLYRWTPEEVEVARGIMGS